MKHKKNPLRKLFKRKSIFVTTYIRTFVSLTIPFILITAYIVILGINTQKNIEKNNMEHSFQKTADFISRSLDTLFSECYFLDTDNTVFSLITSDEPPGSFIYTDVMKNISSVKIRNDIESISIYIPKSRYVLSTDASGDIDDMLDTSWIDMHYDTGYNNYAFPVNDINTDSFTQIGVCHAIIRYSKTIGIIRTTMSADKLFPPSAFKEDYWLVSCDKIIASTDKSSIDKDISGQEFFDFYNSSEICQSNSKTIFQKSRLDNGITIVSKTNYTRSGNIGFYILLMSLFVIIVPAIMSYALSTKYYSDIMDIISSLEIQPNFRYSSEYKNEIEYIKSNISKSDSQIKTLENELNDKIQQLKATQAAALQLQFNPHFLLNTLNLISLKAISLTKSENEVSRIVAQFAELMQISLDTEHYIIPFEEELTLVEKYLNIEQIRYNNSFDIIWDINDIDKNMMIVKFSIQPLVENALKHGIYKLPSKAKKIIRICTQRKDNCFIISIEDNGSCSDKQINEMRGLVSGKDSDILQTKHIGLKNVDSRLRIFFSDKYHCSIAKENGFTKIKLIFEIY